MKTSDLIKTLTKMLEVHGDLEVRMALEVEVPGNYQEGHLTAVRIEQPRYFLGNLEEPETVCLIGE